MCNWKVVAFEECGPLHNATGVSLSVSPHSLTLSVGNFISPPKIKKLHRTWELGNISNQRSSPSLTCLFTSLTLYHFFLPSFQSTAEW